MDDHELDYDELETLTGAARAGDVQAYGRLVERTRGWVEAAARRILHDPAEAEDVAQETYLRAYRHLAELRDLRALPAWLRRTARNLALNRRRRAGSFVGDEALARLAAPTPDDDGRADALARALVTLGADDRRLCERFYHGGWATARLAACMGITDAAVRKRLQRLRHRLREEMEMDTATNLPQRIVELLSRPDLTAIPENPVGAIWEAFRKRYEGFTEVELEERIDADEVRRILGDPEGASVEEHLQAAERQDWLRRELTVSMLVAAARSARDAGPRPQRLIATGKTYRIQDEEGPTKLHAFHQAEVLWIAEGLNEWAVMGPFAQFVDHLCQGAPLRIEGFDYSLYCARGWQVSAARPEGGAEGWASVAGWGRMRDDVVAGMGYDPTRVGAVGLGIGLERLAMLRYGIDDIRKVEAERV